VAGIERHSDIESRPPLWFTWRAISNDGEMVKRRLKAAARA
jgi:hypothetical protein